MSSANHFWNHGYHLRMSFVSYSLHIHEPIAINAFYATMLAFEKFLFMVLAMGMIYSTPKDNYFLYYTLFSWKITPWITILDVRALQEIADFVYNEAFLQNSNWQSWSCIIPACQVVIFGFICHFQAWNLNADERIYLLSSEFTFTVRSNVAWLKLTIVALESKLDFSTYFCLY